MKKVKFSSKLSLNKKTISILQSKELDAVKGGGKGFIGTSGASMAGTCNCPTSIAPTCI